MLGGRAGGLRSFRERSALAHDALGNSEIPGGGKGLTPPNGTGWVGRAHPNIGRTGLVFAVSELYPLSWVGWRGWVGGRTRRTELSSEL